MENTKKNIQIYGRVQLIFEKDILEPRRHEKQAENMAATIPLITVLKLA